MENNNEKIIVLNYWLRSMYKEVKKPFIISIRHVSSYCTNLIYQFKNLNIYALLRALLYFKVLKRFTYYI